MNLLTGDGVKQGGMDSGMFSKKFDRRIYLAVAVILFATSLGLSFGVYVLWPSRREAGYMPGQPLPFSHKLHAGDLKIECLYCHSQADQGPHATVPPISTCMKCHEHVQTRDTQGKLMPGIAILLDHWERSEPLRWNKVNDLADFVYFDHSRHVNADVTCQECHGAVETFEHMQRQYGLKMRWCLACHRQKAEKVRTGNDLDPTTRAPIHCTTCHR